MKRQRVVKESPEKWSEKEDATENKKMKGEKGSKKKNQQGEGEKR